MNAQGKLNATATRLLGQPAVLTSREFNEHIGEAKAAADVGPVIVTEGGNPAYVLLSNAQYERLKNNQRFVSVLESLRDPSPEADFPYEFDQSFDESR